jgi:hypothetical protein
MPQPAKMLHEKHDIVSFFLGGPPPAGASVSSCHAIVEREPGSAEARGAFGFFDLLGNALP